MTSVTSVSESQAVLELLRADPKPQLKGRQLLTFVSSLLKTYGYVYAEQMKAKIDKSAALELDAVYASYHEIQRNLAAGKQFYDSQEFPSTAALIKRHRYESESDEQLFHPMKVRSYEILPFPQRGLVYPEPEIELIEVIENVRKRAFGQLTGRLNADTQSPVEEKTESNRRPSYTQRPLSPEDELALTGLYFNGGALVYDKKPVSFSQLIQIWQSFSNQNAKLHTELLAQLTTSKWIEEISKPIAEFTKFHQERTFKGFLIQCSVAAAQKNLGIDFSASLEQIFDLPLGCLRWQKHRHP